MRVAFLRSCCRLSARSRSLPLRRALSTSTDNNNHKSDADLRAVFDDPHLWQSIASASLSTKAAAGLLGHSNLKEASQLPELCVNTVLKANTLVRRICDLPARFAAEATSKEDALITTAIQFDRLSDLLCSVIDPSEFIRNVVSQPEWKVEAERAYAELCEYMNVLNTHSGLYYVIKAVLDPFEEAPSDSQLYAAYQVSLQFLRDFEKSGIHLPQSKKEQFVALNNDILTHGWHFITASTTDESDSSSTMNKQKALLGHPSSDVRRQAWVRLHNHPTAIASLESLLQSRSELAHLLGYQDYASLALSDKMANTPQAVWRFLDATNAANQERAQADTAYLASLRGLDSVAPWDRDFCTMVVPNPHAPPLSPFFSVGTCIQGLSRLFSRLFGISLHYAPRPEEWMWDEQVRRMEVRDDQSGQVLGCIYMDLFARDGKAPNAAHYTVQCARKRSWDDVEGDRRYVHPSDMPAQQHEILRKPDPNEEKQLPVVVLSLDFGQRSQGPTTLMWQQVETLFHEMGHALHSMLGQSDFQNVSGTRCATDFVELPSILMEHFCASPEVLSLYARHWETDQPLPLDVFAAHQASHQRLSGLEQAHQVTLSALDLAYHTQHQRNDEGWSTPAAWDVLTQYGPPGSSGGGAASTGAAWQMRFTHLASYGATYYAYLLDRAVASRVWSHLFVPGVRREAGEQYRDKVLRWGGGKDPWHCLGDALESDEIWKGGDRAMALVGDPTTQ